MFGTQFDDLINATTSQFADAAPAVPADSIKANAREAWKSVENMSLDDFISRMVNGLVEFTIHLAIAILVFYVGKFIIKKIYKVVDTIFLRRKLDRSLSTFILSLIRIVLYFILIITVIGILGIETSSFLALFASAGVAIGLALSGTLQNFAGGVLILLLKPYKIGDYIEAQGFAGTVKEIQIFSTIINTADNKQIIIPNGPLSTSSINNYSKEDYRRVDWEISISYGDDVAVAKEAILKILTSDDRIVKKYIEDDREKDAVARLEEQVKEEQRKQQLEIEADSRLPWYKKIFTKRKRPVSLALKIEEENAKLRASLPKTDRSPFVALKTLNASSIDMVARAWTRSGSYWDVYFQMNERFYNELPKAGLSFPFPQLDVHLDQPSAPATEK
ncbi:MAG: mechanosensitive ion channel [Bacteroides sp.]|nr:mechanosensitive ion channel [Bacteroides sp.]MCM1390782.1 mechanosensitive ion channel [Bacteroides sp.]